MPPHKPHTKLADLKAKHKSDASWRETVVDDDHLHADYIASAPGTSVSRRFHPDTREWWIVMDGQLRFEIEGQAPVTATRGSMVQVPMQTIYSIATVGDKPALRFGVFEHDALVNRPCVCRGWQAVGVHEHQGVGDQHQRVATQTQSTRHELVDEEQSNGHGGRYPG